MDREQAQRQEHGTGSAVARLPGKELLDLKWADVTYTDLYVQQLEGFETNEDGSIEVDKKGKPVRKTEISEEL